MNRFNAIFKGIANELSIVMDLNGRCFHELSSMLTISKRS